MKVFWMAFAIALFLFVTVMCFKEGFAKWAFYYPFSVLAAGMYFFKTWMMRRMERHIDFMQKKRRFIPKG
jgi:hypothetical protein